MPAAFAVAELMSERRMASAWVAPNCAISWLTTDMGTWLMLRMPDCMWVPTAAL